MADPKCLFDAVINWEQEHIDDDNDFYSPHFRKALKIAKQFGYKALYSKDGSWFGQMFESWQVKEIIRKMTEGKHND